VCSAPTKHIITIAAATGCGNILEKPFLSTILLSTQGKSTTKHLLQEIFNQDLEFLEFG
jgi:hypothetical protein